ncbi:MAG: 16S rRNA processing protein RimM [Bacteroidales bacterium]|nr:16S rRNA processing protein RimM [Bacteroidales bacterium]
MSPIPPKEHKGFFLVGKIIRTHGYKGGLKVILDVDRPEEYRELDVIFIDIKGQLIPWAIEQIHFENNKANLKLTDLHDMEGAEKMVGNYIYLPVELLPKLRGNKFYYHEIIGFTVIDETHGPLGTVERVIELPNNPLLSIKSGQKEILIPISDEIILKVDRRKKQISIKAPEGLIEIYKD